ncbi:hypothetical protein E4U41_002694 [Claviceps citrina]|nr:hypothetical protein E4U41_002694 [Claviceps citrina]
MAFWVVGKPVDDADAASHRRDARAVGDETRYHGGGDGGGHARYEYECGSRVEQQRHQRHCLPYHETESVPVRNLAFLVIREGDDDDRDRDRDRDHDHDRPHSRPHNHNQTNGRRHTPSPSPPPPPSPTPYLPHESPGIHSAHASRPIPAGLERTESGHSISSDSSAHHHHHHHHHHSPLTSSDIPLLQDLQAARLVRDHIALYRRRYTDSQPERILRALISPKSRGADFPLDNEALQSIFSAANELFFASRLTRRVTWDWSHSASAKYDNHILGTTAVRKSTHSDGLETLIVLSSPILRDTKYNRRLIISTFLHEMIHSFMFVTCGWNAKQSSGHTQGFLQIAGIVDDWAGKDCLHLRDMEANLQRWRGDGYGAASAGANGGGGGGAAAAAAAAGDDGYHEATHSHRSIEPPSEVSKYNNPLYLEQANRSWDRRHTLSEHNAHLLHPPLPQRHEEEWQWYEREDLGERLQYVAQTQYGP